MATFGINAATPGEPAAKPSPWFTIEGVALVVLGVLAVLAPVVAAVFAVSLLGWLIFLAGVLGLVSTFAGGRHAHRTWSLVSAAIAIMAGLLIALHPIAGAAALTLLLAAYLLFDGVSLVMLAFDQRKRAAHRWGWLLAAGIGDLLLAVLVLVLNPLGQAVLVGVIVGVDLLLADAALIAQGRGRRLAAS